MTRFAAKLRPVAGLAAGILAIAAAVPAGAQEAGPIADAFAGKRLVESRDFEATGVKLEHINAVIRVLPEDRQTVAIDLYSDAAPDFSVSRGVLKIDGGIESGKRFGWNGWVDWCELREADDRTLMVIHVPMETDMSWQGAVDATVGPAASGSVSSFGCGETEIAAVSGSFSARAGNSTALVIASIGGDTELQAMNSASIEVGPVSGDLSARAMNSARLKLGDVTGNARLNSMNSARLELSSVTGTADMNVMNSADMKIDSIGGDAEASLMNSADLDVGTLAGTLSISQMNGADGRFGRVGGGLRAALQNGSALHIDALPEAGRADLNLDSSGEISIGSGRIDEMRLVLDGDSSLRFEGRVENGIIRLDSDRNSYIAEAGTIRLSRDSHADGDIRFGSVESLSE